jgi:hypothetical protein
VKSIPVLTVAAAVLLLISRWLPSLLARFGLVGETDGLFVVRVVLSAIVLAAALYVVLSKRYAATTEKWAFGAIGSVLGYWLA